jgi:arabinan endo-1,5-alpha-L-arabinosidase
MQRLDSWRAVDSPSVTLPLGDAALMSASGKMRAAWFPGGGVRVDVESPTPGGLEIRQRVHASALRGSDRQAYDHSTGIIRGHEIADSTPLRGDLRRDGIGSLPLAAFAQPTRRLTRSRAPRRPVPRVVLASMIVAVAALAGACGSGSGAPSIRPPGLTYQNPVFNHDAPDPSIVRAPDGTYYVYTTQSQYARWVNMPVLRSRDLVHWRFAGDAFRRPPAWVRAGPTGEVWAPHITRWSGRYRLYYAAKDRRTGGMSIGVAWSLRPLGPFHDLGHPLVKDSIDPFVLRLPGRAPILYHGSGDVLYAQQLRADGLATAGPAHPIYHSSHTPYQTLIEGAWVVVHGGSYYLMFSGDDCCSARAHYAVSVARSRSPYGPFTPDPHNPILAANGHFWAPGHNSTVADPTGRLWILYHAMDDVTGDRKLMIDPIVWRHGWPIVADGHGPSWQPQPAPAGF